MANVTITNATLAPFEASITIFNNPDGNDGWFIIPPGAAENWTRVGWEAVLFRDIDDTERKGIYRQLIAGPTNITFRGFTRDIDVAEP